MWQTFWGKFSMENVYGQEPITLPWIKKTNNYYYRGIIFNMEINLPCVVIAPNKKKVYKSYIGCQERILSWVVCFHTVKPRLIWTHRYYGQFALSLGKESPYIFSKFNPLNTDTPFIRALSMVLLLSLWRRFDCILYFTLYWEGDYTGLYQDVIV